MLLERILKPTSILVVAALIVVALLLIPNDSVEAAPGGQDVPSGTPVESSSPVQLGVPDTSLTIQGCAAPNAFVTLFEDNQPAGTVIADANGRFSKALLSRDFGLHTIKAFYEDENGRTSSSISTNISIKPQANTNLNLFLPPTIDVNPESVFVGDTITFRGTSVPGATINVSVDNNTTYVAIANQRGNWFVAVDTEDFFIGTHVFQAVAAEDSCGQTDVTEKQSFRITRPSRDDFVRGDAPTEPITPIILTPEDQFLAANPGILLTGSAEPNSQLEIIVDGVVVGSVFANARGLWTFPFTMTQDQHSFEARMCTDGRCSTNSNLVTIFYQGDFDGCQLNFRLVSHRFYGLRPGAGIDIEIANLEGLGQYEMLVDWGDTTIEHLNIYRDSQTKYHHVFNSIGQFNGIVTIEDSRGCIYNQYISVDVLEPGEFNWWWLLLLAGPPASVLIYRSTKHLRHIRVRYVN